MTDGELRQPGDVAGELGISTSTLRRWAKEFNPYLSQSAGKPSRTGTGGATHRRYTRSDVEFLGTVKVLLGRGMTYDQVIEHLQGETPAARVEEREGEEAYPVLAQGAEMEAPALGRSFVVVADALRSIGDNQQALQNSLQVNRNLLGVLIQDNFNLKDENSKLRDRVLKLEQAMNELRQDTQSSPLSRQQQRELENRRGCLGTASK
jgi:DNA-binding transcriptional MerR regulator